MMYILVAYIIIYLTIILYALYYNKYSAKNNTVGLRTAPSILNKTFDNDNLLKQIKLNQKIIRILSNNFDPIKKDIFSKYYDIIEEKHNSYINSVRWDENIESYDTTILKEINNEQCKVLDIILLKNAKDKNQIYIGGNGHKNSIALDNLKDKILE